METQGYSESKQIRSLVESIFARVIRSKYDYDRDSRTLQKHLDRAHSIRDQLLAARIVNVHGLMDMFSGHFTDALEQFRQCFEMYQQAQDVGGMTASLNNQAVAHGKMGDDVEALRFYDQGIELADKYAGQIEKHEIMGYGFLLSGKLDTLVTLNQLEDSDQLFDDLWSIADQLVQNDRLNYARMMTIGHRGKAELELSRGEINEAKSALKLALELAELLNLPFGLAEIHLAQAHVACLGDGDGAAADVFWKSAEDVVSTINVPYTGFMYAEEARYLIRRGQIQKARYFVRKATEILNQTRTPEVEQMIRSLSAMLREVG
jgi:tetratricopeptide (TPR) repeat protein